MLEGIRSQIFSVGDLEAAAAWYTLMLGCKPYFEEPFYVGFNVRGYELGLMPIESTATGSVTYWGVSDADAAYAQLIKLGATALQPVADVGGGIRLGSVTDPQGNVLGIIENPHFQHEATE